MAKAAISPISLSRRSLFQLAAGSFLRRLAFLTVLFALVFGVMAASERIDPLDALLSLLVVTAILITVHIPSIDAFLTLRRSLRQIPDFDAAFLGKELRFENGSWRYADNLLLINIGGTSACLLYAPQIDFSEKMRFETRTWTAIYVHRYDRHLRFKDQSGRFRSMRVLPDKQLYSWIASHGGRL